MRTLPPSPPTDGGREAATTVAAHGLAGARCPRPLNALEPPDWDDLLRHVERERLWGFLASALSDEALPCTAEQAAVVFERASQAARSDLLVESRLLQTCIALDEAAIDHRVLKGVTTAHRVYPAPLLRSSGDVDVLVPGSSFDAAAGLLERSGGVRRYAEPRPGFDRRFSKGASFRMPDGISVDLHRTFVLGPYGFTVDLEGVFSRSALVTLAGRELKCLEIHDAAVHACFHAVLGDWPARPIPLRDVIQFVTSGDVDARCILERADEWRARAVVARAVGVARRTYGLGVELPLASWAEDYPEQRWERRALALYGEGRSYRRQARGAARFIPGVVPKLRYARDMALPSRAYLSDRDGSYVRRGVRAWSKVSSDRRWSTRDASPKEGVRRQPSG